jgi:hypothetical protein
MILIKKNLNKIKFKKINFRIKFLKKYKNYLLAFFKKNKYSI